MKTYPLLMLFARHGRLIAHGQLAAGLLATLATYWSTRMATQAGLVLGAVLLLTLATRLAAEVMEVLSETLIPR
jgi:hypothetical protein